MHNVSTIAAFLFEEFLVGPLWFTLAVVFHGIVTVTVTKTVSVIFFLQSCGSDP